MNSAGGFHEGQIDGKPFFIYTSLSPSDTPTYSSSSAESAIDSGGDNLPLLQPLFLCPSLRRKVEELKRKDNDSKSFLPFTTSPLFPNIRSDNNQIQYLLDSESHDQICKLPLVPLFWCNNKGSYSYDFLCGACLSPELGTNYYFCLTCSKMFHKECVESPLEIIHPSYPFLSLQLFSPPKDYLNSMVFCTSCKTSLVNIMYHCTTYNLCMHPTCAMKPIPFIIDHPKSHLHPLTFFPKQAFLPCNVCGLIKENTPTYVCVRCVFVVHQDCIYFPHLIRISRHHHHISFTLSLPSGTWSCGVCRQEVNNHYGAYSCNNCSGYFVHTRCALRRDVWDGKDLEGVPEELDIIVEPFETISDGIILHFPHGHHLKLEITTVYDDDKFCRACTFPIYEGNFYSCQDECDFLLHEACANAPRKKHHALYPYPLILKVVTDGFRHNQNKGFFQCEACLHESCGFVYESIVGICSFKLDLRCASISEPFEYQGHEHPLFLALNPQEEKSAICQICQEEGDTNYYGRKLNCIECSYIICFGCATLPYKARYKHEKHFLTFLEGKEASDQFDWCEVCERKIVYSRKGGFYSCDDCCTTLHVNCLLGEDPYMLKPGQTITTFRGEEFQIRRNNSMSRPFCYDHNEDRCPSKVVFKTENKTFCSFYCLRKPKV